MNFLKNNSNTRKPKFIECLLFWTLVVIIMFSCIVFFNTSPEFPVFFSLFMAIIFAIILGFNWEKIIDFIIYGVSPSIEAFLILLSIGMIISLWVASGTIPTLIYYGLQIISPKHFLLMTYILCSFISMLLGGWGGMGTIGVALFAVGQAYQIDNVLIVGAIVSGSYIGEVISPLSDAPNLTGSVCRCDVIGFIKKALKPTIVAFLVSVVFYFASDMIFNSSIEYSNQGSDAIALLDLLKNNFDISILSLLPVVILLVLILLKLPSLLCMFISIVVSLIIGYFVNGFNIESLLDFAVNGFNIETSNEQFNNMFDIGGSSSMLGVVFIGLIALALGGLTQKTKMTSVFIEPLVKKANSIRSLKALSTFIACCINIVLPDQYISLTMTGNTFLKEFENKGISNEKFASTVITGGAVTSSLVPWNTCGIYILSLYGINAIEYMPVSIFCYALPIISIIFSLIEKSKS